MPGWRAKQPWHFRLTSAKLFVFTGPWTTIAYGESTCAIITTTANDVVRLAHERMPLILHP